jgi:hypothetical protein
MVRRMHSLLICASVYVFKSGVWVRYKVPMGTLLRYSIFLDKIRVVLVAMLQSKQNKSC